MPRLPLELCEIIISNLNADLSNDEATLRACSLTCRAFLPASRYRLFYHVDLRRRHTAERFLNTICCTQSSTNPIRFIHRLSICEDLEPGGIWVNDGLPILATSLLDVTFLKLADVCWSTFDGYTRTSLLSGFRKVTSLQLYSATFTADELSRFLSSFPSLTNLSHIRNWTTDGILTAPHAPPCRLSTITILSQQSMFFHQLLSQSHHHVRDLDVYMLPKYAKSTGMLLKTLGASLENLKIRYLDGQFSSRLFDA
jgi:hypothetical protein